jgi:hypothetical protein
MFFKDLDGFTMGFYGCEKSGSFLEVQWLNARSLGKMEGWSWDYHSMEYPAW